MVTHTTFLLAVRFDEVVALLLNFTAMEFAAEMDGLGLAKSGYLGVILGATALQVENYRYEKSQPGCVFQVSRSNDVLQEKQ